MWSTCGVHAQYMRSTCGVHVEYMPRTCTEYMLTSTTRTSDGRRGELSMEQHGRYDLPSVICLTPNDSFHLIPSSSLASRSSAFLPFKLCHSLPTSLNALASSLPSPSASPPIPLPPPLCSSSHLLSCVLLCRSKKQSNPAKATPFFQQRGSRVGSMIQLRR